MAKTTEIWLPTTPPTMNYAVKRHWAIFNKMKQEIQRQVEVYLIERRGRAPMATPVSVDALLRFPTRRGRDAENYSAMLSKSVGDALVNGRWIPNDTPPYYKFRDLIFEHEMGPHRTILFFYEP
jgi:hypothetical protein